MILATPERIKEYTQKGFWGQKTLLDYFKEHVAEMPTRVALVDPLNREELVGSSPERITYQQLDRAVNVVAFSLVEMGLVKDDIIMLQLPNTWELAMLYLAIARAGGLASPAPMQWRLKELEYIAKLTGARAFITVEDFKGFPHRATGEDLRARVPGLKYVWTLPEIREFARDQPDPAVLDAIPVDANDIFTLCWTSGTEAEPKGCPLSHNNWLYQSNIGIKASDIRPGDVQFTAGPLVNMASIGTTYIPWLVLGGTYVLHYPFDPQLFMKQMITKRCRKAPGFIRGI